MYKDSVFMIVWTPFSNNSSSRWREKYTVIVTHDRVDTHFIPIVIMEGQTSTVILCDEVDKCSKYCPEEHMSAVVISYRIHPSIIHLFIVAPLFHLHSHEALSFTWVCNLSNQLNYYFHYVIVLAEWKLEVSQTTHSILLASKTWLHKEKKGKTKISY